MVMQNILGNLAGLGAVAAAKPLDATQQPFKTSLVPTDGDTTLGAGTALANAIAILAAATVVGQRVLFWQYTVKAQEQARWGFGSPVTPMNQGYMWFGACSAAAYNQGKLRLVQAKARATLTKTVADLDDNQLHFSTAVYTVAAMTMNNKNDMMALPEKREFPKVGEDSMLQLWYEVVIPIVTTIMSFSIPITVYH